MAKKLEKPRKPEKSLIQKAMSGTQLRKISQEARQPGEVIFTWRPFTRGEYDFIKEILLLEYERDEDTTKRQVILQILQKQFFNYSDKGRTGCFCCGHEEILTHIPDYCCSTPDLRTQPVREFFKVLARGS